MLRIGVDTHQLSYALGDSHESNMKGLHQTGECEMIKL